MDAASNQLAPGDLRASDADRDRALAALSEHYQAGRLTLEEFEERSEQTLKSKTAGELTGLFTDLPATTQVLAPPSGQAIAVPGARPYLPVARVIVTAVGIAALAIVVSVLARTGLGHIGGPHRGFAVPVPLFVVLFVVVRMVAGRRARRRGSLPDAPVQDR